MLSTRNTPCYTTHNTTHHAIDTQHTMLSTLNTPCFLHTAHHAFYTQHTMLRTQHTMLCYAATSCHVLLDILILLLIFYIFYIHLLSLTFLSCHCYCFIMTFVGTDNVLQRVPHLVYYCLYSTYSTSTCCFLLLFIHACHHDVCRYRQCIATCSTSCGHYRNHPRSPRTSRHMVQNRISRWSYCYLPTLSIAASQVMTFVLVGSSLVDVVVTVAVAVGMVILQVHLSLSC